MSIDISNINSYYYTTSVEVNSSYCSKEFYYEGAIWTIKIENVTNSSMDIKILFNGNPINSSVRLSINNGNNNEYFNIDRKNHYIHNYNIEEFYNKSFCLYKFEYDSIENIHEITIGITLLKDSSEYSYLQYFSEKVIPENYILLPNASSFNNIYIHEINNKQYIYCKYIDQINNFNNFIQEYSDVEFEIGKYQKIIKAHRVILASRCPSFKELFEKQNLIHGESNDCLKIVLPDEDYVSFKALIDYLYKGKCYLPKSKRIIDNLLNLAYQYHVNNLIESIEEEISDHENIYVEDEIEENEIDTYDEDRDINLNNQDIHLFTLDNSVIAKKLKYQECFNNNQVKRKRKLNETDNESLNEQLITSKRRHSNDRFEVTRINDQGNEYYDYESINYDMEEPSLINERVEYDIAAFNNIHLIKEPSIGEESFLNEMQVIHDDSENSDQQPSKEINVEIIDIETGLSESSNSEENEDHEINMIEVNEVSSETFSNDDDDNEVYGTVDNSIEYIKYNENQEIKEEDGYENEGEEIEEDEDSYNESEIINIDKENSSSSSSTDTESDEIQQEDDNNDYNFESEYNKNEEESNNAELENDENSEEVNDINNEEETYNENEYDENKNDKQSVELYVLEDHDDKYDFPITNEEINQLEDMHNNDFYNEVSLNNNISLNDQNMNIEEDIDEFYNENKKDRNNNKEINITHSNEEDKNEVLSDNEYVMEDNVSGKDIQENENENENEFISYDNGSELQDDNADRNENEEIIINEELNHHDDYIVDEQPLAEIEKNLDDVLDNQQPEEQEIHEKEDIEKDQNNIIENQQFEDIPNDNIENQQIEYIPNDNIENQQIEDIPNDNIDNQQIEDIPNDNIENQQIEDIPNNDIEYQHLNEENELTVEEEEQNLDDQQFQEKQQIDNKQQNEEIQYYDIEDQQTKENMQSIEEKQDDNLEEIQQYQENEQQIEEIHYDNSEEHQLQEDEQQIEEQDDNLEDQQLQENVINEDIQYDDNIEQLQENEEQVNVVENQEIDEDEDQNNKYNLEKSEQYEELNDNDNELEGIQEQYYMEEQNENKGNNKNNEIQTFEEMNEDNENQIGNDVEEINHYNMKENIDNQEAIEDNNDYNTNNNKYDNMENNESKIIINSTNNNHNNNNNNNNDNNNNNSNNNKEIIENNDNMDEIMIEEHQTLVDNITDVIIDNNIDNNETDTFINDEDDIEEVSVDQSMEGDNINDSNNLIEDKANEIKDSILMEENQDLYNDNSMEEDHIVNDIEELNNQIILNDNTTFNHNAHHGYYNESIINENF